MNQIDIQLITAVEQDNYIEVEKLLFQGADLNRLYAEVDKVNVLEIAVKHEAIHSLPILLSYNPITLNTYFDDDEYHTPLNYAVDMCTQGNDFIMAEALLKANANPRISSSYGYTPLHSAALAHDLNLIKLLLHHNSNPNKKQSNDTSCLEQLLFILWESGLNGQPQELVETKVIECMQPLLADHAAPDLGEYSFIRIATELNFNRVLTALEQTKLYPLHIAASLSEDRTEFITLIESHKLEAFNELDSKGRTPLDIATKHDNLMTKQVLSCYKKVCDRRKDMQTNDDTAGLQLPAALNIQKLNITDYLKPKDFTFFTTATNTHIRRAVVNPTEENTDSNRRQQRRLLI